MNALPLSRPLGWFSLLLGTAEVAVPATLFRGLSLPGCSWPVCTFGFSSPLAGAGFDTAPLATKESR